MRLRLLVIKLFIVVSCILFISTSSATVKNVHATTSRYLSKPTGQYEVGFEDFHWINKNICPDPNFNKKNFQDFSLTNTNYCREIMIRVYYPSVLHNHLKSFYYPPFIKWQQQDIQKKMPAIQVSQLAQMTKIKSYSAEKLPIVKGKKFPLLLFSPGFGFPAQAYENFLVELASHGYIVVGINSPFINRVALPNGHVVEEAQMKSFDEFENNLVPLQIKDLFFTLDEVSLLSKSNPIFSAIDFNHVGAFGHSIGGRIIADAVHAHPKRFQAAATLDIGIDESGKSLKKFSVPFMHIISANRKLAPQTPVTFELGDNAYLVGIAANERDHNYSRHDNFSDLSTLQNLPALKTVDAYNKERFHAGFNVKLLPHVPTNQERNQFNKISYILIKKANKWSFSIYEKKQKTNDIDVTMVDKLPEALLALPKKSPEQLSDVEIEPIKKVMISLHSILGASYLGTGDGFTITNSINTYLVNFFDQYLKNKENITFKKCLPSFQHTYIKCGPGDA